MLVDLFFYLALAAEIISERPSNKVDVAYFYYLPFCHVFSSGDKLHERVAPLFLRENQTFVRAADLKADLSKLDQHFALLPPEVTDRGLYHFAKHPPDDPSFLVTQLWDKHLPGWREERRKEKEKEPLGEEAKRALLELVNRVQKATSADPPDGMSMTKRNIRIDSQRPLSEGQMEKVSSRGSEKRWMTTRVNPIANAH